MSDKTANPPTAQPAAQPAAQPGNPRLGRAFARLMGEAPPPESVSKHPRAPEPAAPKPAQHSAEKPKGQPGEHGGPKGPEPTRYGDWERKGRCIDF